MSDMKKMLIDEDIFFIFICRIDYNIENKIRYIVVVI